MYACDIPLGAFIGSTLSMAFSVYLASPYRTLFAKQPCRFRTLTIPLPFCNPFLFWLCLILFTFSGPFLFWFARLLILFTFSDPFLLWFARLLDTFHVQRSISFQVLLYPSRVQAVQALLSAWYHFVQRLGPLFSIVDRIR